MMNSRRIKVTGLLSVAALAALVCAGWLLLAPSNILLADEGGGDPNPRQEEDDPRLVLIDTNTDASKSDTTDNPEDAPTLYCTGPLPAGTGTVEIRLESEDEDGVYDWEIQGTAYSGVFNGTYVATQSGLLPETYTLVVTCRDDAEFLRVIDFAVIELGEYLPASYPEGEIPVTEVSETTPYYYSDDGELRSITVSAPIDGDEGADNPYEYDNNYTITINPDNGTATVSLELPGVYMLQIIRENGGQTDIIYQTLGYGSDGKSGLDPATWPWVCILKPHWDYYVGPITNENVFVWSWNSVTISKGKWNCWNIAQEQAGDTSIERLVNAKYAALGNQKFDLCVDEHGTAGKVNSRKGGDIDKNNVAATLGNQIAGKVNRIRFYSCETGKPPDGGNMLQNLKNASGATEVSGYVSETSVSWWPYIWTAGKWGNKTVK